MNATVLNSPNLKNCALKEPFCESESLPAFVREHSENLATKKFDGRLKAGMRTHGAYYTLDEAKAGGQQYIRMLNGVPFGYGLCIATRLGAFVVVSYPLNQAESA